MSRVLLSTAVFAIAFGSLAAAPTATSTTRYNYTSCHVDSDGDGIVDCYETNTGVYVSPTDTGTDPANPDTDGDGLSDGDEVYGTAGGLNLPFFGVSPVHKDILLEYDWMEDATGCVAHSHKPPQGAIDIVSNVFANAPVSNPDGTTGIHVFQDVHYSPVSNINYHSNLIPDADGIIHGNIHWPPGGDWDTYEAAYFSSNRQNYFHYVIFAHEYDDAPNSSGSATIPGYEMIISMGCYWYAPDWKIAATIVHELGHNLSLRHGGNTECNYKPNYNSVMNYQYQMSGIATCALAPTGVVSYSRGTRRALDESNLYEPDGVCTLADNPSGPVPIDWNYNGVIDTTHYARVLTPPNVGCPSGYPTLYDYNDYANLDLPGIHSSSAEVEICAPTSVLY